MMPLQLHLKIEPLPRLFHVLVVTEVAADGTAEHSHQKLNLQDLSQQL